MKEYKKRIQRQKKEKGDLKNENTNHVQHRQ